MLCRSTLLLLQSAYLLAPSPVLGFFGYVFGCFRRASDEYTIPVWKINPARRMGWYETENMRYTQTHGLPSMDHQNK